MGKKQKPDDALSRSVAALKLAFLAGIVLLGILGLPVIMAALVEGGK